MKKFLLIIFLLLSSQVWGQADDPLSDMDDEDFTVGSDIFTDFNEDLEASQIMEDERFYRHGRYFSILFSLGTTQFTGNRGLAYKEDPPSYGFSVLYFSNFQSAFGLGFEYSKHHFGIYDKTIGYQERDPNTSLGGPGMVDVGMLRVFFSYRYYIDTADLGTAITYSHPYFIGRMEYWYQRNKFIDHEINTESGGGLGFGYGFGLEFPVVLKESYVGVEFLYHSVNFFDKNTANYQPLETEDNPNPTHGYDDMGGDVITAMISYVISW